MKKEDIEEMFHRAELAFRPYCIFVNPLQKDMFEQALRESGMEDRFLLREDVFVERDKAYVMRRDVLEKWTRPEIDLSKVWTDLKEVSNEE